MESTMNFHCMIKSGLSTQDLKKAFNELDMVGYKSFLLTFSSEGSDYLVKAANAYQDGQSTGLMFAIRPYAMSPRYLAMMIKSLNEITNNQIMINIIAGTFDKEADLFVTNTSIDDRKAFAGEFVKKLREHCLDLQITPKVYFSGSSTQTISNVEEHGDGIIMLLSDYIRNKSIINSLGKEAIARAFILVDESDDISKARFDALPNGREKENCIYGTKQSVLAQLTEIGCSDFLISGIPYDHYNESVNSLVKHTS